MIENRRLRRLAKSLTNRGIEPSVEILTDIMTTAEAAQYCRLGKPTLERFRISGNGPAYLKIGGAVRYRRRDLDDWLASRLTRSTSEAAQ